MVAPRFSDRLESPGSTSARICNGSGRPAQCFRLTFDGGIRIRMSGSRSVHLDLVSKILGPKYTYYWSSTIAPDSSKSPAFKFTWIAASSDELIPYIRLGHGQMLSPASDVLQLLRMNSTILPIAIYLVRELLSTLDVRRADKLVANKRLYLGSFRYRYILAFKSEFLAILLFASPEDIEPTSTRRSSPLPIFTPGLVGSSSKRSQY